MKGIVIWFFVIGGFFYIASVFNEDKISDDSYLKGDMSQSGGSPTYRYSDTPVLEDNPYTSNYESNDQLVGFYGTETMYACNQSSGNCYDLDVDSNGEEVERIYFPNGGWVDVDYSDCDSGYCYVTDENGTDWELEY